ncbi:MAG TPA: hypothetical protein ENJ84_10690, partial [Gammaproteobacteria bacterium]|nr:hypothetical protein [Gammaproteobacteria bacterium]
MEQQKLETQDLKSRIKQAEEIKITPGTAFFVDKETGSFIGPTAEGTMGIIIYAGLAKTIEEDSLNNAQAIRIPRLLQSDELLNFHIAEISFHEGLQSLKAVDMPGLGGAKVDLRPDRPNQYATIPGGDDSPCYVGFYLSPSTDYRLALISENQAWPKKFAQYIDDIGYQPKTLYQEITDHIAQTRKAGEYASLETVLYLSSTYESHQAAETARSTTSGNGQKISAPLRYLGRSQIENAYKRKDIGGWWFNLPMYQYSWMTADLERLLTGILDDDVSKNEDAEFAQLARWQPRSWLWLCRTLALGLGGLHSKGLIHGDPRPANIMARLSENDDLQPDHFRWIDVGLGYGQTQHNNKGDASDSAPAPPPLGGGRVTPFYAPERIESVEFEDADLIHLTKLEDGNYKL